MDEQFKPVSTKKIQGFSKEQKIEYYKKLQEYYLSLPYDEKKRKVNEKRFLRVARVLVTMTDFLYRPKFINFDKPVERIDGKGLIYVSNHLHSLDQFPIISAIGKDKPLIILAKNTLLKLKRGIIYKYVGCEFVDMNSAKSEISAIRELEKSVLHGKDILIFPEGTRNSTKEYMLPFKIGAALIAQETGTKIVPIAINEDYRCLQKNYLYVRRGSEIVVSPYDDLYNKNQMLEESVRALIWENMELEQRKRIEQCDVIKRDDVIRQYTKKQRKLEGERKKINKN